MFGQEAVLPIDFTEESILMANWEKIRTPAELLEARMIQIENREADKAVARERVKASRGASVAYHNDRFSDRQQDRDFRSGDLVLVRNSQQDNGRGVQKEPRLTRALVIIAMMMVVTTQTTTTVTRRRQNPPQTTESNVTGVAVATATTVSLQTGSPDTTRLWVKTFTVIRTQTVLGERSLESIMASLLAPSRRGCALSWWKPRSTQSSFGIVTGTLTEILLRKRSGKLRLGPPNTGRRR